MATTQSLDDIKLYDVVSYQYPDSDHLWGLRVMTEPSEVEGFQAHMTETGKDWMVGIHHSLIPTGYELVKRKPYIEADDFLKNGIRINKNIWLTFALLDIEDPTDDFMAFCADENEVFVINKINDSLIANRLDIEFSSIEDAANFYDAQTQDNLIEIQYSAYICTNKGDSIENSTFICGCKSSRWVLADSTDIALDYAQSLSNMMKAESFYKARPTNE
jgi:hypothetical protein